jgi:lipoprotein-releasing system permease protein
MSSLADPRLPSFPYYLLFLSLRYLRSRLSALAALLSVTFGVAVILIARSIMGGYVDELREIIRGQESHISVMGPRRYSVTRVARLEKVIREVPNVAAVSPFVDTLAMYRGAQFKPCQLRGILPETEPLVSGIARYLLREGELETVLAEVGIDRTGAPEGTRERSAPLAGQSPAATRMIDSILDAPGRQPLSPAEVAAFYQRDFRQRILEKRNPDILPALEGKIPPAVLVGANLLLEREMFLGQVITLVTLAPGTTEPVTRKFVVAGAFKSGDFDSDSGWLYAHVDAVRSMLGLNDPGSGTNRYDGVRVSIHDLSKLEDTRTTIQTAVANEFPELAFNGSVQTWEEHPRGRNLLRAVDLEKFLISLMLLLLMSFTGGMILLMLVLTVIEKTRDIGVLLALGATPGGVVRVFLSNGLILSAVGILLGLGLGYVFCTHINAIHDWIYVQTGRRLFPAEIYHMDRIPIAFRWDDTLFTILPPVIFGFIASLAPAIWASLRDPIKAIHHE